MTEPLSSFTLPSLIVSPTELIRVRRELQALDEYLEAQRLREPGQAMARLPKVSRLLDELAIQNKLNLLHATVRHDLGMYLQQLQDHAPVVTVSFAAEPSAAALDKIVVWFRQNIRSTVLVRIGLQPNIVAGCIVRTTNQYFDFSLKRYLQEHRAFLIDQLTAPVAAATTETSHE